MVLSQADTDRADRVLKRNIAKRDAILSQIQFLYDLSLKVEKNDELLPLFRARKKDIDILRTQFSAEQDNIFDLLIQLQREDEYHTTHVPLGDTLSEQYYMIMAISDAIQDSPTSSTYVASVHDSSHIQLPKIQIPSFDGDILSWISFRDIFLSLVHNNNALSNIEKFHYLLSAVTGSARAVTRSIPLSDANYEVAWNALVERFDNQRLIINAHMDKLFSFPPLKSSSLNELKIFLDTFKENIGALNSFNVPNKEGFIMFYIAFRLLDSTTKFQFESQHKNNSLPVLDDLLKFVQTRCNVIENSLSSIPPLQNNVKPKSVFKKPPSYPRHSLIATPDEPKGGCPLCKAPHYIGKCEYFLDLSTALRLQKIKTLRLCTNCLSTTHSVSKCTSKYSCRHCKAKHHSLLHFDPSKTSTEAFSQNSNTSQSTIDNSASTFVGTVNSSNLNVLGTALIRIRDKTGHWLPVRALLDSGSQISAITHACATQLGLARRQNTVNVLGLSQSPIVQTKGCVTCSIIPHMSSHPELSCEPIVLSKITSAMPSAVLDPSIRSTYYNVQFADPSFDCPGRIDFLLGADLYNKIFEEGFQVRHTAGLPSAFETTLGWIFIGTSSQSPLSVSRMCLTVSSEPSLNRLLHRFWEIEEPVVLPEPFTEEQKCEDHFCRSTTRDTKGRYSVTFPFKTNPDVLGDSRAMALSRFFNLERKLQTESELYDEYRTFMQEYLLLGHMKPVTTSGKYIIPHHAVVKKINNKIKIRVVFDASARTSSGKSLNDLLFTGQKLQCDIMDLLIRCRLHKYMFTADIAKMYRQINLSSADQKYQHILWRNDPAEPLQEYALTTVTYGVASAPFQAIRVLHQLEIDEGHQYPIAKDVLSTQTYVDDIITGEETVQQLLTLQTQVVQLLKHGGFELKKWASNCKEVLENVPVEDQLGELSFDPKDDSSIKILGLHWDPKLDVFSYHSAPFLSTPTKRSVLSSIAKVYDPIGVLAPITFWAKHFMQLLWKNCYEWDQPISNELSTLWGMFSSQLPLLSSIKINRHIPIEQCTEAQLVGFSDASLKGYAAVVYIRLVNASKNITVHLLTSKSKVAPVKSGLIEESLSIPRLELCGALLLAQTLNRVQKTLSPSIKLLSLHAWTDSTVVLTWLTSSQIQFKVFVTNRLKRIAELVPDCHWHYVSTTQNPADCVSRGLLPKEALDHKLYWNGPEFLKQSITPWSPTKLNVVPIDQLPERKPNTDVVHLNIIEEDWLNRFSSFTRLRRTLVFMRRFIAHTRGLPVYSGFIRYSELEDALKVLVRIMQAREYHGLLTCLSSNEDTRLPSSLARLMPFIDSDKIIRVGGRLRNSNAPADFKCPILLPKKCVLTVLLVRHYHITHLHAGPQLVASLLSARFWIMSNRSIIRHIIYKCVTCARHRASNSTPIMGDLPKSRICPSRPFSSVGIDYAGPLLIKEGKRRNARSIKCYLAIFICMAVKAVHIEVVSDLSTATFIAALHRFVSRRGIPSNIYSDCGTNFQGADVVLSSFMQNPDAQNLFTEAVPCQWHFNPPAAPHFGGLWEAAVKSAKYHIKRVVGSQLLTFEEMSTFTHRVEAVLNSRPITPQSTDPNDLRALTPGDFLIGCPLVALPEPDLSTTQMNRLTRWQLLTQFNQAFWKRWSSEYLTTLQSRSKWYRKQKNLMVGDLVLVNRPNIPPTFWKMGRIECTHPGPDGVVRVVSVRTQDGVYKRPVVKLALLPVEDSSYS